MARPYFAAARDVASSPSGWAKQCIAAGLKPSGSEVFSKVNVMQNIQMAGSPTLIPNIDEDRSMLSTLTNILGLIL
jgi:hypothetical protein